MKSEYFTCSESDAIYLYGYLMVSFLTFFLNFRIDSDPMYALWKEKLKHMG